MNKLILLFDHFVSGKQQSLLLIKIILNHLYNYKIFHIGNLLKFGEEIQEK